MQVWTSAALATHNKYTSRQEAAMRYIDTAFGHLGFAIKLMQAAEDGALDIEAIDIPLTVNEGHDVLVLPDRVLSGPGDLILACQNLVSITYGAAAITLNRCREEADVPLPNPIETEIDQWVALVYQIRNAFAHDIAEPRWQMIDRYQREYEIGPVRADLRELNGGHFDYAQVGGASGLFHLKRFGEACAFGRVGFEEA